jgi:citrate synthase
MAVVVLLIVLAVIAFLLYQSVQDARRRAEAGGAPARPEPRRAPPKPKPRPKRHRSSSGPRTSGPSTSASCATQTGLITYDPGYANTGSAQSAVTYLDGEAASCATAATRSSSWRSTRLPRDLLPADLRRAADPRQLDAFRRPASPGTRCCTRTCAVLRRVPEERPPDGDPVGGHLGAVDLLPGHYDPFDPDDVEVSTYRLMAKLPTVAAWAYKKSIGQAYIYPRNDLDFAENFLHMMFAVHAEPYEVDPEIARR